MRVLLLEDTGIKQQKIKNVLDQENHDVTICCSVQDFRNHVNKWEYDLAIVDLLIPLINADPPNERGGYQAIEYLRNTTDIIHRPSNVLALSEYINTNKIVELNKLNVKGIEYDTDGKWEDELMNEMEQISLLSKHKVDVVIITAVDVEMEQVKKTFPDLQRLKVNDEVAFFQADIINAKEEKISLVICQQLRKGMVAAANLTTKAIELFDPDCVIMTGIAGGNSKEVELGDIVIAADAFDYCSGSIEENGDDIKFLPEPQSISAPGLIMRKMRNYRGDNTLLRKLRDDCGELKGDRDISLHIAKMATGPAVIKSKKFTEQYIKNHHKDYYAIDMETYGVYYSAKYSQNPNIQYVAIKSISDGADKDKADHYQKYCSRLTANLVKYFIENDYDKVY